MFDILLLRFDAPLMSFGGPIVDNFGKTQEFPAISLMAGLLGNALGFDHRETEKLQALQSRIRHAVRRDRLGKRLTDYQTVDLGQDFLVDSGWTTRGSVSKRGSGEATSGTHIRYRDYLADAVYSIALRLEPSEEKPILSDVESALQSPARPLFLGRKPCLPAAPLFLKRVKASSLIEAMGLIPCLPSSRADRISSGITIWFPDGEPFAGESELVPVTDERDWENQIHVGQRLVRRAVITLPEGESHD